MGIEFRQVPIRELIAHGMAKLQTGPFGSQLHKHEYVDAGAGVPVIPTEGIGRGRIRADVNLPYVSVKKASELHRHRLQEGDILFARRGIQATGLSACVDGDHVGSLCGTGAILLRVDRSSIHPRFLAAFLATDAAFNWLRSHAVGAVMPNLNTDIISGLVVPFPPIQTQIDIGNFVAALDDRIDLLRQTNATLEAIAQALFKSWFVDFDPVHAKAEGREPEAMDAATAALFPSEFEESELGPIPKGWRVAQLAELCSKVQNGGTPSRKNSEFWEDGEISWFKTGELADGFLLDSSEKITQLALERSSAKLLPRYAILMAIYAAPTVGRLGVLSQPSASNQACTAMIARVYVGPWFLFQTLKLGRDWYNNRANGAAQQNISKSIVESLPCIEPTRDVLGAFSNAVGPIYERIELSSQSIATLATLRDMLLPRLISGKLRLPKTRELVEADA